MKSRIFFASAFLLLCTEAFCCGPYWWTPQEYYMFRVYDKEAFRSWNPDRDENCKAWKALTGGKADEKDICEVVYGYNAGQMERLLSDRSSGNSFARYIAETQDVETADFLKLAKTCETARHELIDPWYYPSKNDPTLASLEDVISRSLSYTGERLEDRYVLQAVRAMFSLERFGQIDSLWKAREAQMKEGVIKRMARGYVAGAAYNLGEKDKALEYYIENGDLKSMKAFYPQYRSNESVLAFAAEHCPDSPDVPAILQETVSKFEQDLEVEFLRESNEKDVRTLIRICDRAALNAAEPGIWLYTSAFLSDMCGDDRAAARSYTLAQSSAMSDFMRESVKVLGIYLDARHSVYDEAYKERLFSQISWLDEKIRTCITSNVREVTAEGYRMHYGLSYYYWNDMLRKVLIGYVAPRMDETDPILALRLRNMADNRLLGIVDRFSFGQWYENEWHEKPKVVSMAEYRADTKEDNIYDYSNYFFEALDTLALDAVAAYEKSLGAGESEMDRWLDERGYADHDYLRELIGTRYLRERNYAEAVRYLSMVSPAYEARTNVYRYFRRLPFEYEARKGKTVSAYKLSFAKEMDALERKMQSDDPDERGAAMFRYGLGMRSSFGYCWALTHYSLSESTEWQDSDYCKAVLKDAERYIMDGCSTIRDPETAAKAYATLCRFREAVERFPDTKTAQKLQSQCDRLVDYRFSRKSIY